jgi:uncharacterized protein HemY
MRPVQLAEKSVKLFREHENVNTLGAALYRAGRFDAAVQRLNEAVKLAGKDGSSYDFLFLAMAHHRLGHTAAARQWRDKAVQRIGQNKRLDWEQRIELPLLRKEAEGMIGSARR